MPWLLAIFIAVLVVMVLVKRDEAPQQPELPAIEVSPAMIQINHQNQQMDALLARLTVANQRMQESPQLCSPLRFDDATKVRLGDCAALLRESVEELAD